MERKSDSGKDEFDFEGTSKVGSGERKKISLFFNKRFTIKGRHWKPTNIKSSDM